MSGRGRALQKTWLRRNPPRRAVRGGYGIEFMWTGDRPYRLICAGQTL